MIAILSWILMRRTGPKTRREETPVALHVPDESPHLHVDRKTHESEGQNVISELGTENEIQELRANDSPDWGRRVDPGTNK